MSANLNITRLECKEYCSNNRLHLQAPHLNRTRLECKDKLDTLTGLRPIKFEYNQIGM